jgi:hypothetical protein
MINDQMVHKKSCFDIPSGVLSTEDHCSILFLNTNWQHHGLKFIFELLSQYKCIIEVDVHVHDPY